MLVSLVMLHDCCSNKSSMITCHAALVERGSCTCTTTARVAQGAGALAVLVVNCKEGNNLEFVGSIICSSYWSAWNAVNASYKRMKVENVIKQIKKIFPKDGLVPIYISPESGEATTSKITFGAMGDSFYVPLENVDPGNKTEAVREYREMWEQSMEGLMTLIKKSTPSSFSYIAERVGQNSLIDKMDELACFAPGMLVLGSVSIC